MWAVSRAVYCPDGAVLHEFLSLDSSDRVFWTGFHSNITVFDDYDLASKYVAALNFLYGYKLCSVTSGPDWTPDVGFPHG